MEDFNGGVSLEPSPVVDGTLSRAQPFDVIYAAYRPLLRRLAMQRFGIAATDAEDLVQDVFATYLTNREVRDPRSYLIGGICNASRQFLRRQDAAPFCSAPDHLMCALSANDGGPFNDVLTTQTLRQTLARLGERCRETLERFYLAGESTVAIAASRDTTPNYVCRLLNYCRNRARTIYRTMDAGL